MPLSPGTRLGRYEIVRPLGAGGMGEVYAARDTRLERDVAIKILPESVARDPERLARFEREAKVVAALSHPNVLALHDAGTEPSTSSGQGGTTFAVMELLTGETLRERLTHGALSARRAIEVAVQVARGLAAAHAKGLVHRDLKPENVFLVSDGQVKILDFGLAKAADADVATATATHVAMTDPGTVLGTVGYMAPEQVRGQAIDARTDLFALGAVLFEMVTGERAFRRETAAETMTAILREDPPDLPPQQVAQSPVLDRIIRHCLEKNPAERFQSAKDVAFALDAITGATTSGASKSELPQPVSSRRRLGLLPAAALLVLAAVAVAVLSGYLRIGSAGTDVSAISYQPVTFDEGFVYAARFARDGRSVVYSADWENRPARDVFDRSLDRPEVRGLGFSGNDLLAVARDGGLAILMDGTIPSGNPYQRRGTIATASLTAGTPRRGLPNVSFADFAPDGALVVSRDVEGAAGTVAIEWPQGTPIVTGQPFQTFPNLRVSPSGDHVAFFTCVFQPRRSCWTHIADRKGTVIARSAGFDDWWGLAWSPGGREVWFAANVESGVQQTTLFGLDLAGRQRLLMRFPDAVTLHDISADGRLLASFDQIVQRLEARSTASAPARDLSWQEAGFLIDVSDDGTVLTAGRGGLYVWRPGDAEPLRVSKGVGLALSPDGGTVLVRYESNPITVALVPTSGLERPVDVGAVESVVGGGWLKDGRLVIELKRPGGEFTVFARPAAGGPLVPLLPPNIGLFSPRFLAPDGQRLAAFDIAKNIPVICMVPATGLGSCAPVPGLTTEGAFAGWSLDSRSVYIHRNYPTPVRIDRVDIATGRREPVPPLQPATAAITGVTNLIIKPTGAMVYSYTRNRSQLYVISGLK